MKSFNIGVIVVYTTTVQNPVEETENISVSWDNVYSGKEREGEIVVKFELGT